VTPEAGAWRPDPQALLACLGATEDGHIEAMCRLSGGANMETWSFDLERAGHRRPLILRRNPVRGDDLRTAPESIDALMKAPGLPTEAALMELARRGGVPVPSVIAQSPHESALGEAIIMNRVTGEALPGRIHRDEGLARARRMLPFQCGEALGKLHATALEDCPAGLRDLSWEADLDRLQTLCDHFGNASPVHQLALNWLRSQPRPQGARVLCHGDFRLGNLLVGPGGLQAVLDWELAHIGFPGEDLGYLCANVWRFGGAEPVAGMGPYRELLDGYRSVRDDVPAQAELKRWELYAALGWGLVCLRMRELHRSGADEGLERAAVGRRLAESEIDILLLLEELDP